MRTTKSGKAGGECRVPRWPDLNLRPVGAPTAPDVPQVGKFGKGLSLLFLQRERLVQLLPQTRWQINGVAVAFPALRIIVVRRQRRHEKDTEIRAPEPIASGLDPETWHRFVDLQSKCSCAAFHVRKYTNLTTGIDGTCCETLVKLWRESHALSRTPWTSVCSHLGRDLPSCSSSVCQ